MTTNPSIDQVRTAWDRLAPRFDEVITPLTLRFGEEVLRRVDLEPGSRVLDVACGTGALAIPAARRGADVTAVDLAPTMIARLAVRARAEGVQVDGRVMDAHDLDLPDGQYDVAVSLNGVTMSPRLSAALTEMVRVTRPGGTVLVAAFGPLPHVEFLSTFVAAVRAVVPDFTGPPLSPPPPPFQLADPDVVVRRLAAAGLREVAVDTVVWEMPVASGADLWAEVTSSNPIGAQLVVGLTEEQEGAALTSLDQSLRARFGGRPGGVLRAPVNVGTGRV